MIKLSNWKNWYPTNRLKLIYKHSNICYWCGIPTIYWIRNGERCELPPSNSASVDHLFSKKM